MILEQHRMVAQARGEAENLRAIRSGMKYVLPGQAQFALWRANDARRRHAYGEVLRYLGEAMLAAPLPVARVVTRRALRESRAYLPRAHSVMN